MRILKARAGYAQKEVKLIGAGAGPVLIAALQRGKIDVAIQTIPVPETAIFKDIGIPFVTNSAGEDPEMDQFMMEVLLVRPDYAKKNPETVRKVVRALLKANNWINKHTAEQIREKIQLYFAKTDKRLLRTSIAAVKKAVSLDGKVTQRAVDIAQNLLIAAGKLKRRSGSTLSDGVSARKRSYHFRPENRGEGLLRACPRRRRFMRRASNSLYQEPA